MTDWDPSAVAAALRTENRFAGGSVVGVLAVGHAQTRMWVLESELLDDSPAASVAGTPKILAENRLDDVGSEMFDRLLLERAIERIAGLPGVEAEVAGKLRTAKGEPWRKLRLRLTTDVRRAREELVDWHSATVDVEGIPGVDADGPLRLDRIEQDNALREHVLRTARTFQSTIEASGRRPATLDGIFLLGDGKMPLIVRSVYDVLGVSPEMLGQGGAARVRAGAKAARNGSARPVPGQGGPISPASGLSLRPTPKAKSKKAGAVAVDEPGAFVTPGKNVESSAPEVELTDTGSLRLLGHPGDGFDVEAASAQPGRRRRRLVPIAGGLVVLVAAGAIVTGLVRNQETPAPRTTDTVEAASMNTSPGPGADLAAVTGLSVREMGPAISLTWDEVAGAGAYAVYRDPGTATENVHTTTQPKLTDRPGDGREHTYAVVALAEEPTPASPAPEASPGAPEASPGAPEASPEASPAAAPAALQTAMTVQAKATTPYGRQQNIASDWTGIVPARPGLKGSAGQTCRAQGGTAGAQGRIVCSYPGKLTITVFGYGSKTATDRRYDALAKMKGINSGQWNVRLRDDVNATGRLLVGGRGTNTWRWWDYESAPSYAMQANWPGHTSRELAAWVQKRMPFHS